MDKSTFLFKKNCYEIFIDRLTIETRSEQLSYANSPYYQTNNSSMEAGLASFRELVKWHIMIHHFNPLTATDIIKSVCLFNKAAIPLSDKRRLRSIHAVIYNVYYHSVEELADLQQKHL